MSEHTIPHHVIFDANDSAPEVQEARHLLRAGQVDEAIAMLEPLTVNSPDDYLLYEVLGVGYAQKGNLTAAVGAFETASHLNPVQPQTHFNLGQALLRAGQKEPAHEAFSRALRMDPTYGKARDALADMDHKAAEEKAAHQKAEQENAPGF